MEFTQQQLLILSIALTNFYDQVCKDGTTVGMKKDIMATSKILNDKISMVMTK